MSQAGIYAADEAAKRAELIERTLPETGKYLLDDWCLILGGNTPRTIKQHAKEKGIPLIELGAVVIVDAEIWWNALRTKTKPSATHIRKVSRT